MARIRTIKPEFHAHEELSSLPAETHLLAAALLNYADDEGYFNANPVLLKAGTTPLRNDQTRLEEQLAQLEGCGYIQMHHLGTVRIGWVVKFTEHQRVSNPTPSKLKGKFAQLPSGSVPATEELRKSSREVPEPLRAEGKGMEGNGTGNGKEQSAQAREEFQIPEWVDRKALDRFVAMRKKNRKPVADEALPLLVKKLEALRRAGNDPTAVLDQSVENSWTGLFEARSEKRSGATLGMAEQQPVDDQESVEYWRRMRDKGLAMYQQAPNWVKAQLEAASEVKA